MKYTGLLISKRMHELCVHANAMRTGFSKHFYSPPSQRVDHWSDSFKLANIGLLAGVFFATISFCAVCILAFCVLHLSAVCFFLFAKIFFAAKSLLFAALLLYLIKTHSVAFWMQFQYQFSYLRETMHDSRDYTRQLTALFVPYVCVSVLCFI